VLAQEARAGTPKQPSEDEGDHDGVVELPQDRDEVRHEVEGKGEVDEGEAGDDLPARGHAGVRQEPLEEDGAVRDEPREDADVPLAGANGQDDYQRYIGTDENDGSEDEPLHAAAHPRGWRGYSGRPSAARASAFVLNARSPAILPSRTS
jgi:hypothetical protein